MTSTTAPFAPLEAPAGPRRSWGSHLQTLAALLPFRSGVQRSQPARPVDERLELPVEGGGVLVVDCTWQPVRAPLVVLLHGVGGHSDDPYVVRAAHMLERRGFHTARVNQRGSGKGRGRADRLYHAGLSDDAHVVVNALGNQPNVAGVGLLGFSLGGHIALLHAAEVGQQSAPSPVRAVAVISSPVDLEACLRRFDENRRGMSALYERAIVMNLRSLAAAAWKRQTADRATRGDTQPPGFTLEDIKSVKDFASFDVRITVPSWGFAGRDDYYQKSNVFHRMKSIAVPVLAIHAEDDPIVPAGPWRRASLPGNVEVEIFSSGGHVGFVESLRDLFIGGKAIAHATDFLAKHLPLP